MRAKEKKKKEKNIHNHPPPSIHPIHARYILFHLIVQTPSPSPLI